MIFSVRHEKLTLEALAQRYDVFRIPLWQRGYAWGQEQIDRFCTIVEKTNACPGLIVLIEGIPDERTALVVDGQQRLRTLSHLLAANSSNQPLKLSRDSPEEEDILSKFKWSSNLPKLESCRMIVTNIKIKKPETTDQEAQRNFDREEVRLAVRHFERINRQRMNLLPVDRLKANILVELRRNKEIMEPAVFDECWERLRAAVWIDGLTRAQWNELRSGHLPASIGLQTPRTAQRLNSQEASLMRLLMSADRLAEHADVKEGLSRQNLAELRKQFDKQFDPRTWKRHEPFCSLLRRIADVATDTRALMLRRGDEDDEKALFDVIKDKEAHGRLLWLECLLSAVETTWVGSLPFLLILRELVREGQYDLDDRCANAVRAVQSWLVPKLAFEDAGALTARDWFLYRAVWLSDDESESIRSAMASAMADAAAAQVRKRGAASCWSGREDLFEKIAAAMKIRFGSAGGNFPSKGGGREIDHWIPLERGNHKFSDEQKEKNRRNLLEKNCMRAHIPNGLNQSWRNANPDEKKTDLFNNSSKAAGCWPTLLFMAVLTDLLGERFPEDTNLDELEDFADGLESFWGNFSSALQTNIPKEGVGPAGAQL